MKKNSKYCQCALERRNSNSSISTQVAFIPEKFARPSETIRLKNEDGSWEDGWVVTSVGHAVNGENLPDSHRQIKSHRNATGDTTKRLKR